MCSLFWLDHAQSLSRIRLVFVLFSRMMKEYRIPLCPSASLLEPVESANKREREKKGEETTLTHSLTHLKKKNGVDAESKGTYLPGLPH